MTVIFKDDFELGLGIYSVFGAPAIATAPVHHSVHSLSAAFGGNYVRKSIDAVDLVHARFAVRFPMAPTINAGWDTSILNVQSATGNAFAFGLDNPSNDGVTFLFKLENSHDSVITDSAIQMAINTWYYIELAYSRAISGYGRLWVNGNLAASSSLNTSGWDAVTIVGLGGLDTGYNGMVICECLEISTEYIGVETTNDPIIYSTAIVAEATQLPSCSLGVVGNYGARVRTVRHATKLSPWTAQ